jgi:hypothetical protein
MKTVQWILITGRVLSVCFGLTLLNSGCGDQSAAPGGISSEEEKKRDADTRKAMEAASKAATKH